MGKTTYAERFNSGSTWGRPRMYATPEEMAGKVIDYFTYCEGEYKEVEVTVKGSKGEADSKKTIKECTREPESPTITGICLFLGFESRSSFDEQAKRSDEFSYIVKRAKMVVEGRYEGMLSSDSVAGAIFALKNMGWKDRQEIDTNQNVNMNMSGTVSTMEVDYSKLSDAALREIAALNTPTGEGESGTM
jgi:hypothetical protein